MRTRGMAATAVNITAIAAAFEYEEPKLRQLLDAPTADLVKEFLLSLTSKADEFEDAKSDLVKKDVELENAFRTNESRVKASKASASKLSKENEELRAKVSAQETSLENLQTTIDRIKNSSIDSAAETEIFQTRITSLEASNRDLIAAIEAKTTSNDKLALDIAAQQQKIITYKLELTTIEEKAQSLENAAASTRFREQTLAQEIELLRRNNEWHERELLARGDEHNKFRKERNARIAELQRLNEEANNAVDSLKKTEAALRQQTDSLTLRAETSFAKVQQLEEQASNADKNFAIELSSANRLAELHRQSAETSRSRLLELQDNIESVKDAAAAEIGQLQAEIETERCEREASEQKVADLEREIERVSEIAATVQSNAPTPVTPSRAVLGNSTATPRRPGSPALFTPGSVRNKGNLNFTQLVSEVNTLRSELEAERRRGAALTVQLDELIQDLESRGPEQEDARLEKERMEHEVIEMSSLLDAATTERDEAVRAQEQTEAHVNSLQDEAAVLRQQSRDLSAQVKLLLVEMQAREQGLEDLTAAEQARLQNLATGFTEDDAEIDQTSAGALITQRLLLFKNVAELQEQNVQLLRLNRGLADKMEGDAAKARDARETDYIRELEELRIRVQRYQDEIRTMTTQADGIMRERDMFRRMLSHRGSISANANLQALFGQSIDGRAEPPTTPGRQQLNGDVEQTPRAKQDSDYAKLIKDLQSHLDVTRSEAASSHNILKEQVDNLAKEKNDCQSELNRVSGQLSLAHERYEMLQANFRMVQSENGELQKRSQKLSENAAVQDVRTQQVAEELIEARTLADSMRTETANLKAERDLWKRVENRLTEDNATLRDEKSRLNKMFANLQNLQNERELADSETRRKTQARIEFLEGELDNVRKKLEAEIEDSRKAISRRDFEVDQNKKRIDELLAGHAAVREELVAVKSLKQQYGDRVEELKTELRSAEEQIELLKPRQNTEGHVHVSNSALSTSNDDISTEQALRAEMIDLKRELSLAQGELQKTTAQVEQYKAISQASEEELHSFIETHDQYREEMDGILAEKQDKIEQLEQRVLDMDSELTTSNKQLSDIRSQHDQSRVLLEQQKVALESEVARLRDESERQFETAKLFQEDLKAQAEIAQQAQQSYEDELVKHADAARTLHSVRDEYNSLRKEVTAIKAEAEAAKLSLSQNEESWSEVRDRYEREHAELNEARKELLSQNKLLHEQLEMVGSQVATIQQQRTATQEGTDDQDPGDSSSANLQEVIRYLRREKEIVDVQYEMSAQEAKRVRQQLDYVQSQLEETRQKLDEERRLQVDKDNSTANHSQLLQTINELNLYRESSATLRQEARQAHTQLQEKIKELENVTSRLFPLQDCVRQLEEDLQTKEGEIRLLEVDRDMWRDRTQNIISKHDRVDPAEMESLKKQITDLQTERDELLAKLDELQRQLDQVPVQIQAIRDAADKDWQDKKAKLVEQAKARSRDQVAKLRETERELAGIKEERDRISADLLQAQQKLETVTQDHDQVEAESAQEIVPHPTRPDEDDEEGQINEDGAAAAESGEADNEALNVAISRAEDAEARASAESARNLDLSKILAAAQEQVTELETRIVSLVSIFLVFVILISKMAQQAQLDTTTAEFVQEDGITRAEAGQLEAMKIELATAQEQLAALRAAAEDPRQATAFEGAASSNEDIASQVSQEVASIKEQLESQHKDRMKDLETVHTTRLEKMKQQLNNKLREGKEKSREEARKELHARHETELNLLKQRHKEEILELQETHRLDVEKLQAEAAEALAAAKATPAAVGSTHEKGADSKEAEPREVKSEPTSSTIPLEISEVQAKELVLKNPVIRNLLKTNIQARVREEATRLTAEHEKTIQAKIEEANADREQAVQKAVTMEGMKQKAKLGMAEGSTRAAKAKLDVVEAAARDTPQKPVFEVWEVAKLAKPVALTAAPTVATPVKSLPASQPDTSPVKDVAASLAPTSSVPVQSQAPVPEEPDRLAARQARFGAPSAVVGAPIQPPAVTSSVSTFGKPSFTPQQTSPKNLGSTTTSPGAALPTSQATNTAQARGGANLRGIPRAGASMLPRGGGGRGSGRGGLPQASGAPAANRGSGLPRGGGVLRGSGPYRGGRGRGAEGVESKSEGAEQVGAKRPLQDGGAAAQGDEKRIRGPSGAAKS